VYCGLLFSHKKKAGDRVQVLWRGRWTLDGGADTAVVIQ
jgi:hypothetical protein